MTVVEAGGNIILVENMYVTKSALQSTDCQEKDSMAELEGLSVPAALLLFLMVARFRLREIV